MIVALAFKNGKTDYVDVASDRVVAIELIIPPAQPVPEQANDPIPEGLAFRTVTFRRTRVVIQHPTGRVGETVRFYEEV